MRTILFLWIAVVAGLTACKPLQPSGTGKSGSNPDGIAFVTLAIRNTGAPYCDIDLIGYQKTKGQVKENPLKNLLNPVDVILGDSAQKPVAQFQIEHPLIESLEFTDDQGRLQKILRKVDSATIYLRFNHIPSIKYIRFHSAGSVDPAINSQILLTK